jgi:Mg2+-importing ATPase
MENFSIIAREEEQKLFQELETSFEGLDENKVQNKLKKYGLNKIATFKIDFWEIIKRNSFNFFNFLLLLAGLLSFLINGIKIETILIFFFLFLSVLIAIWQDFRANKLTEKLLHYFKNYTFVKRNNSWQKIFAENLVPGDIVKVNAGYLVPADIKILKAEDALIDESIITGESEPIIKSEKFIENPKNVIPSNIALMGTTLIKGEIEGIVFATGKNSYFGKIAKKTLEIPKETAYKKMLDDFAKKISYVAIFIALFVILINFLKPEPVNLTEIVIFAIVLTIAAVPEFLPAMTVLTLSLASLRLAKNGLLIKRLSAIEDLGAIEILCTDKTGTITTNKLQLEKIISDNEEEFVKYFLADYFFTKEGTPYEFALLEKYQLPKYNDLEFIEDIDFDPITRSKKIILKKIDTGENIEIIKGAPEELIKNLKADEKWLKIFQEEDQAGLRTLALALNDQFLGIACFSDPIKNTAFSAVKLAKNLNIEIKVLTGDSLNVARNVALKLGIIDENEKVVSGEELRNLDEEKLKEVVKETKVFARVLPEDKLKIVEILQKEKFVAFLGEGINDAPALKIANVALVVDTASDVTKQEADIILKRKDLKTIIDGIYEGRKSLENIGKYIKHTMSDNFGNLISISILTSFLPFVPLTPLQVLLTNFLTDIPLIAFANDNVKTKEIKKPLKMSSYHLIFLLLILGSIAGLINIIGYLLVKNQSPEIIRTYIFFLTTLTGLIVSFSIRTKDWFLLSKPSIFFGIMTILALSLTLTFVFYPYFQKIFQFTLLDKKLIISSIILSLIFVIFNEIAKKIFYKKFPEVI